VTIKKLSKNELEKFSKETIKNSFGIKLLQEQLKDVEEQIKLSNSEYNLGRVSENDYKDLKAELENERKKFVERLNKKIEGSLEDVNKFHSFVESLKMKS